MSGEEISAVSMQSLGLEQRGAQLGAMPAGMEPQAQAGDRNPGERRGNNGGLQLL